MSKAGQLISTESDSQGGFSHLRSLKSLTVSNANLSSLEATWFRVPNQVSDIDATGNNIRELSYLRDLVSLPNLKKLDLTRNFINNISFSDDNSINQLEILILSDNQIDNLDFLPRLANLRELHAKNNDLKMVTRPQFSNTRNVELVNLAKNYISVVEPGAFDDLTMLRSLNLSHNALANASFFTILSNLKNIQSLDLSFNELTALTDLGLYKLTSMRSLNLSNNFIQSLQATSLAGLFCLRELKLNDNELTNIHPFAFNQLYQLEYLDLSSNSLTELGPNLFTTGGRMLKRLLLSKNQIMTIDGNLFQYTRKLVQLDLSDNKIKTLPSYLFNQLTSLRVLHLNNNQLERFTMKDIEQSSDMMVVLLNSNRLTNVGDLDNKMLNRLRKMTVLTIDDNPWQCACMDETKNVLEQSKINYSFESNYFDNKNNRLLCFMTDNCYKNLTVKHENLIRDVFYSS